MVSRSINIIEFYPAKNANYRLANRWSILKLKKSLHDYLANVDEK